jgi:hypothetical protein
MLNQKQQTHLKNPKERGNNKIDKKAFEQNTKKGFQMLSLNLGSAST